MQITSSAVHLPSIGGMALECTMRLQLFSSGCKSLITVVSVAGAVSRASQMFAFCGDAQASVTFASGFILARKGSGLAWGVCTRVFPSSVT